MSRREHMFLRALAVGVLVSLHFLPHAPSVAEERGSAAGAGTASTVLALTP